MLGPVDTELSEVRSSARVADGEAQDHRPWRSKLRPLRMLARGIANAGAPISTRLNAAGLNARRTTPFREAGKSSPAMPRINCRAGLPSLVTGHGLCPWREDLALTH